MRQHGVGPGPARLLRAFLLAGLGLPALASLGWGGFHALTRSADLMRRAEEVALVIEGLNPYLDPDMTYPPTAPAVFVPLVAPFAARPAALRAFWLVLNLASLGLLSVLILRKWDRRGSWVAWAAFAALLAAGKPTRLAIGMGQFALLPLALVFLAEELARRGRGTLAGLALAVALVKPTMVLPFLVVFLLRGHRRCLAVALAAQGVSLAGLSAWLGIAPNVLIRQWLTLARGQQAAGLIDVPSLAASWSGGLAEASGLITLAVLGLGSIILIACRRAPDRTLLAFAGFVAAIMAYHRPYDLVLLFPALAVLIEGARSVEIVTSRRGIAAWGAVLVVAILLIAPAHPRVIAEGTYNSLFIPVAYLFLAGTAWQLARQAWPKTTGTGPLRSRFPGVPVTVGTR